VRDPRRDPRPGDVLRCPDGLVRLVRRRIGGDARVIWSRVIWVYNNAGTVCYKPGETACWIWSWWKWARRVEVIRMGEERTAEEKHEDVNATDDEGVVNWVRRTDLWVRDEARAT